jgi:hypothetical protein
VEPGSAVEGRTVVDAGLIAIAVSFLLLRLPHARDPAEAGLPEVVGQKSFTVSRESSYSNAIRIYHPAITIGKSLD